MRGVELEGSARSILKFSATPQGPEGAGTTISFLVDDVSQLAPLNPPGYPITDTLRVHHLGVNLAVTPADGTSFTVQLYKNGSPVDGFAVTYEAGQTGVRTLRGVKPVKFERGDTLDLAAIAVNFAGSEVGAVSATLAIDTEIKGESTESRHR